MGGQPAGDHDRRVDRVECAVCDGVRRWGHRCLSFGLAWLLVCVSCESLVRAEEPYERFLDKLRQERLFDLALDYLTELESTPGVSSKFKADVELERGILLYQSAALLSFRAPLRGERLDAAEAALRQFLEQKREHPRRGEARLKLGNLLLTRADEAREQAKSSAPPGTATDDMPAGTTEVLEAIKFYEEAHQLFENTVSELAGSLEQLRGNRVDPSDTEKVAYRDGIQRDIRQAQLLSAKSVEERGRSRTANSPDWQKDLEQALTMYSDLYSKEQKNPVIRNYSLFYRSSIHATLGKADDAIDGFQRIADADIDDGLRPLKTDAIAELLPLLAEQGKHEPAFDRAEKWLKGMRSDERNSSETIKLQLAFAKFRMDWADKLQQAGGDERLVPRLTRDSRSDLRSLLRTPGPHLEEARQLLGRLGVEPPEAKATEVAKVKDFAEAFAEAQKRLDQSETDSIGIQVLNAKAADPSLDAEAKQAAVDELAELQRAIATTREEALQLLRQGITLYTAKDDRGLLFDARFRMAFLLVKLERPWDAIAIGDFLCRTNAGTEQGLRAAAVTLTGFSLLLNAAGEDKSQVTAQLEPFAEYLVATWPQSPEAASAAAALAQLSMIAKDWDKAERFLAIVPETNAAIGKQRRDLGISFYIEYLQSKREAGEETQATEAFRKQAIRWLELGTRDLAADKYDAAVVEGVNSLARLLLLDGRVDDAARVMLDGDKGLLVQLANKPDLASPKTSMESFRTSIQIIAAQLVAGTIDDSQAVGLMRDYINRLQELAKSTPDGEQILSTISVALARDMKDKLAATQDNAQRKRLSEAVLLVIGEAAKSDSFSTQYWAGSTNIALAEDLTQQPGGKPAAEKAFREGAEILRGILAKEQSQAGWIQPAAAKTQIQVTLAKAMRGVGDYQAAVLALGEILDANNALLDVQIEAAEALQAWGKVKPDLYKLAILGGRKKSGQNVIWGWGKIAQMTTNQANFTEQFYNARYQLTLSRLRYAASLTDNAVKQEELRRAEKEILSTAALYPQLGGPAKKKQFDALLKEIQTALGKPAKGL